jgi:DNA-binding MarR family transcriptional regulator
VFDRRVKSAVALDPIEIRILSFIKEKSQTEKKISKRLGIEPLVLSPVITDLILKEYLEIYRRRRLYFFSRELCTITQLGVLALEKTQSPLENLVEIIRQKASETLDSISAESLALKTVVMSAKTLYKVAKAIS